MANIDDITYPDSASGTTFAQKLLALYERFAYVQKTGHNSHFKYKFFEESAMKRKLNLALRELGLVIRSTSVCPVGECTGKAAVVKFWMELANADDLTQTVSLEGIGGGMDSGDKAPMKAVVAAMKYALANGLAVETGNDPEADASTDENAEAALLARINDAPTRPALELLKPDVASFKGSDTFDALRAAWRAKADSFGGVA